MSLSDQSQTNLAVACLLACIVRTLDARFPGVRQEVEAEAQKTYYRVREYESPSIHVMETLRWFGEELREPK